MKKIIKPCQHEVVEYSDDFTGKTFDGYPPVNITLDCVYGSGHDGSMYQFHCDDIFLEKLLNFLDENLDTGNVQDRDAMDE
jgi:hypothetical protein